MLKNFRMDLAGVIHKENYIIECAKIYGVTYLCGKQNNWRNLVSIATPVLLYLAQQKKTAENASKYTAFVMKTLSTNRSMVEDD